MTIERGHPVRITAGRVKGTEGVVLYDIEDGFAIVRSFTKSLLGDDNPRFRVEVEHLERIAMPAIETGKKMKHRKLATGNAERTARGTGKAAGKRKAVA